MVRDPGLSAQRAIEAPDSEVGRGTTVKIYFPHVDKPEAVSQEDRVAALPTGTETILLVEDDDAVRLLAIRMLQQLGYSVLEAPRPSDALALYRDWHEVVDLVLTDIVMPEMSGGDLVTQLRVLRPDVPVLFMSGHTRAMIKNGEPELAARLIEKPLDIQRVAHRVREALDERPT